MRKHREEWLRKRPCQACWRNEQAGAAMAQSEQMNLPALEGSEADKEWAQVIRAKAIAHNREYHQRLVNSKGLDTQDAELRLAIVSAADAALGEIEAQVSAAWWIEHRFDALNYIREKTAAAIAPIMGAGEAGADR
ncbi:MAG: hypothetical protein HUU46_01805 [Candidatus Hydrogenedentes bacterium]|nr:hypothetical protein [Candidatus Hydrogenedentota bacterium]